MALQSVSVLFVGVVLAWSVAAPSDRECFNTYNVDGNETKGSSAFTVKKTLDGERILCENGKSQNK